VIPSSGPGGLPLAGDWDGDGLDTTGVRRGNKTFARLRDDTAVAGWAWAFGLDGDLPVSGRWIRRPSGNRP